MRRPIFRAVYWQTPGCQFDDRGPVPPTAEIDLLHLITQEPRPYMIHSIHVYDRAMAIMQRTDAAAGGGHGQGGDDDEQQQHSRLSVVMQEVWLTW